MSIISRQVKATTITFADTFFNEAGEPQTEKKTLVVAGKIADKKKAAAYLTKRFGAEHSFLVLSVTESNEKYEMDLDDFLAAAHRAGVSETAADATTEPKSGLSGMFDNMHIPNVEFDESGKVHVDEDTGSNPA